MTLQQTDWLMGSLPECAGIFKATDARNYPDWVIVQFDVEPSEAKREDMKKKVSGVYPTRTKALKDSAITAQETDSHATEKAHMGVWRIQKDGKVYWQTVWPVAYLP